MRRQEHYLTSFLFMLLISVYLLSGCSSSKNSATFYAETAAAQADRDFGTNQQTSVEPAEDAADMGEAESSLTSSTSILPANSNRKMIRIVNLATETTEFDQLLTNIAATITELNGYIEQSDISGNSLYSGYTNQRYASLTLRIPANQLDSFVAQVSQQGNITHKSESTQDVTLQYTDIESRKKALNVEQERLWELLAKAESIESIIALEQRLSEIRYQLETMESQLRTYDNQVDYSTVYLNVNEVKIFTPTAPDSVSQRIQKGFSANLERVATGLVNFFVWFISSLPSIVLLALIVFLMWMAIKLIRKINKNKHPFLQKKKHQKKQEPNP